MDFRTHYTSEEISTAYLNCRKRKSNCGTTIKFEFDLIPNLYQLLNSINDRTYQIKPSIVFVVDKPKYREIWAAQFIDRIAHHLIYQELQTDIEKTFIEDSYSCIKGRGTGLAIQRTDEFIRRATNHYDKDAYYLQFDIKNYFGSINKYILWDLLIPYLNESDLTSWLTYEILFHDPTIDPIKHEYASFDKVPIHKSLWNSPFYIGLPIGNITSQFFSNVYLNPLDQYIKHQLSCKYYGRYVDDAIIIDNDPSRLLEYKYSIDAFLKEYLNLEIHPDKCTIANTRDSINFVGAIFKDYHILSRPSLISSAKSIASNVSTFPSEHNVASFNSYMGLLRQTSSYKTRKRLCSDTYIPTILSCDKDFTKLLKHIHI